MRELTYVARRTVEWREVPDPVLRSELDAIVAPVAAAPCDVDSAILAGHGPIPPPFAIGHECVARVVDAGDASRFAPGDLVVVPWAISCGTCDRCAGGLTAHCTSVPHMAMFGAPIGGAARRAAVAGDVPDRCDHAGRAGQRAGPPARGAGARDVRAGRSWPGGVRGVRLGAAAGGVAERHLKPVFTRA